MPILLDLPTPHVPVKVWTDDLDAASRAQLENVARLPIVHHHVAAMPDVHLGIGATIGAVQVHSVRMPGYLLSCEAVFGASDERLVIRHDAGTSAAPYVAGTLHAARHVRDVKGLRRGLDQLLD